MMSVQFYFSVFINAASAAELSIVQLSDAEIHYHPKISWIESRGDVSIFLYTVLPV